MITVWLAVTTALLAVAAVVSIDATAGLRVNPAGAEAPDPTGARPTIILDDTDGDHDTETAAHQSVVYGSLEWTLVEVRTVPRGKETFSRPVIILEMVVRNLDDGYQARARRRDVNLILDDGALAPMDRFEHTPSTNRLTVAPGQTKAATLVFKPAVARDPWLDDMALHIGAENRRPAVLPLDGSEPETEYPQSTTVMGATGDTPARVQSGSSSVDLSVIEAELDVNAGPYRAMLNERLLKVVVRVDPGVPSLNPDDSEADADPGWSDGHLPRWLNRDFWQLSVESGEQIAAGPTAPYHVSPLSRRGEGSGPAPAVTVELVFVIPAEGDTSTMALRAGSRNVKIGTIEP